MTIIYGTNGVLTINGQTVPVGAWEAEKDDTEDAMPHFFPRKRFTVFFHVRQTRWQRIDTRRFFGLPTSLHRRERRRARKARG